MANQEKTYFLVPNWDFPAGSIVLGTIFDNLEDPESQLFVPAEGDVDTDKHPTDKFKYTQTVDTAKKGKMGFFARFLDIVGLGAEASYQFERKHVDSYSFGHMHTEWIKPSKALIDKAVASDDVSSFLQQTGYKEPVYMVCGVKTVKGASVTTSRRRGRGFRAMFGLDLAAAGVPVAIGPQAERDTTQQDDASFERSSHIVFAYRIKEIRRTEDGKTEVKDHKIGAVMGADGTKHVLEAEAGYVSTKLDVIEVYDEGEAEGAGSESNEEAGPCFVVV
jgi:hypothetical protein